MQSFLYLCALKYAGIEYIYRISHEDIGNRRKAIGAGI